MNCWKQLQHNTSSVRKLGFWQPVNYLLLLTVKLLICKSIKPVQPVKNPPFLVLCERWLLLAFWHVEILFRVFQQPQPWDVPLLPALGLALPDRNRGGLFLGLLGGGFFVVAVEELILVGNPNSCLFGR